MERLKGVGVSPGLTGGPALVAIQRTQVLRFPIAPDGVARELSALDRARVRSRDQLERIRQRVSDLAGTELAALFDAQLLILDDPLVVGRAAAIVRDDRVNAEWAVQRVMDELAAVFDETADPYLRERKGDLHDVAGRLRMNMRGEKGAGGDPLEGLETPCVLVADELTPSVVAQLDWSRILGFATDAGSRTYHTAILARSLGVPAVVGLHDASRRVPPGASVIVDGDTGEITIDPLPADLRAASLHASAARRDISVSRRPPGPAVTRDGTRIRLLANIERADDVDAALEAGAEGIGLFRSEFLLAGGPPDSVSEDEQYEAYRQVVARAVPHPVTIRTFDIDGAQLDRPVTDPALGTRWFREERSRHAGLRGVRLGLAQPDLLRTQLRALLRAAAHGPLRILLPFVSSAHEVRAARVLLDEARRDLLAQGTAAPPVALGIMIEVPSAAVTAPLLAREADFFTIGTNDLIQYTLAVDRTDDRVSDRYEPLHPAILRLIRQVGRAGARRQIPVSVCGEMASDPLLMRVMIGWGLTEFSMTPGAITLAREAVRGTSAAEMRRIAAEVLRLGTVEEIEQRLMSALSTAEQENEVSAR